MYHYDEPVVVLAEERPRAPLSFTVPDATPGRYLVVIYNGSESGFHYTWDFYTVTAPTPAQADEDSGTGWWPIAAAIIALLMSLVAGIWVARRWSIERSSRQ